jgi:hypothetical protein
MLQCGKTAGGESGVKAARVRTVGAVLALALAVAACGGEVRVVVPETVADTADVTETGTETGTGTGTETGTETGTDSSPLEGEAGWGGEDEPGTDADAGPEPDPGPLARPEAEPVPETVTEAETASPACVPNHDGLLEAHEVPVVLGAAVSFRVNPVGTVVTVPDLAGQACEAGLCWDLSAIPAGDEVEVDQVRAIGDFWFAAAFPADAVVVPLDGRTGDLAVYRMTPNAFQMLGMASEAVGWTRLVYDPPVDLLAFPMQKGSAWATEEAQADGLFEGASYPDLYGNHVVHTYRFVVNGEGQVKVPAGSFRALRLLLDLTMEARNLWGVPYEIPNLAQTQHYKVYDFLAECVGLVARVRSTEGELATFFDQATEYKRMGL